MKNLTLTLILLTLILSQLITPNSSSAFPIPDTGQTKCYDNEKEIPCPQPGEPFYGQDANYTINPMSYTKLDASGNDLPDSAKKWVMVRDNVTGLIWEVKTDDGSVHDKDNTYNWQNAQDVFIAQLNAEKFGGYSDWRLPTLEDLHSIVDFSIHYPGPGINTEYFPNTMDNDYWSSYSFAADTDKAWFVDFGGGWVARCYYGKNHHSNFVRAVRGGQPQSFDTLVINGDGTVTDDGTGLTWQQNCPGKMTWKNALEYCENLSLGGHNDWRLPSIKEIFSLVDYSKSKPAINSDIFPNINYYFSSSTTNISGTNRAKFADFYFGDVQGTLSKTGDDIFGYGYVLAVRGGQSGSFDNSDILEISHTPVYGTPKTPFTQWGNGFTKNGSATIHYFTYPDNTPIHTETIEIEPDGTFSRAFTPPKLDYGEYLYYAVDNATGRRTDDKTYKIVESPVPNLGMDPDGGGPQGTTFNLFGNGFTATDKAQLKILNPDGSVLEDKEIEISAQGGIEYSLKIADDAPLGEYMWWAVDKATDFKAVELRFTITKGGGVTITPASPLKPGNHEEISVSTYLFEWEHPHNDEYELIIKEETGKIIIQKEKTTAKSINVDLSSLEAGKNYKWIVMVYALDTSAKSVESFFTYKGGQSDITPPTLFSPENNATITGNEITFKWEHSFDDEYELFIMNMYDTVIYESGRIKTKEINVNLSGEEFSSAYGEKFRWGVIVYAKDLSAYSEERFFTYGSLQDDQTVLHIRIKDTGNSGVSKVAIFNDNRWEQPDSDDESIRVKEIDADRKSVQFTKADLEKYFKERGEIKRIDLLGSDNDIKGHIVFEYKKKDFENGDKFDLFLKIHSDLETNYEDYYYNYYKKLPGKWHYYAKKDEKPVSMLIPPGKKEGENSTLIHSESLINHDNKPVLFVHGVSGAYPYFGDRPTDLSRLVPSDDVWQFYYPYDGEIQTSGKMLNRAIQDILKGYDFNTGSYEREKVYIIAHSMGGLVTRSYIQSESYANDIEKFIMFGTPNHGSNVAYKLFYTFWNDEIGGFKDDQGPAYKEMTPGSEFMYELNTESLERFTNEFSEDNCIVIAGRSDKFLGLPHEEIPNQDDGVVAVSSASMLKYGIPLAVVNQHHLELKDEFSMAILRIFLDRSGMATLERLEERSEVQGLWRNSSEQIKKIESNGFNDDEGILTIKMTGTIPHKLPGSLYISKVPFYDIINIDSFFLGERIFNKLEQIPDTSNYFSRSLTLIDGIPLIDFNPAIDKPIYHIGFSFPEKLYSLDFRYYMKKYKVINDGIDFKHLETNMYKIDFSEAESVFLNAANIAPSQQQSQLQGFSLKSLDNSKNYYVDKSVEYINFLLNPDGEGASLNNHDMQLVSPSGIIIDKEYAQNSDTIDFQENIEEGFAYYYVKNPEPGEWQVKYNADIPASLTVPVISNLDTEIVIPDENYNINEEVTFEINISQLTECDDSQLNASLYYMPSDSDTWTYLNTILLSLKDDNTGYKGVFKPSDIGVYKISVEFLCNFNGEPVQRKSQDFISVHEFVIYEEPDPPATSSLTASAGPDQTVNEKTKVTLNAAADNPAGTLTVNWTQLSGPTVVLSSTSSSSPTFTAPEINEDNAVLTFQLTITDSTGTQASDTCIVTVKNKSIEEEGPGPDDDSPGCFISTISLI